MTDQLFSNEQPTPVVATQTTTVVDPYADLLKTIKNESGEPKYDSVQKALEALGHSQQFIPTLKSQLTERDTELERLKAELAQRETIEQTIQRLTAKQTVTEGTPPVQNGLDEQAVLRLVQDYQKQTDAQRQASVNTDKVQNALVSKFGDKAKEVIAAKAAELGTSPAELGALASRSPDMILALFNTQAPQGVRPTTGGVHLPSNPSQLPELKAPTQSLMGGSGATDKARAEFMRQIRERVYAENGITS